MSGSQAAAEYGHLTASCFFNTCENLNKIMYSYCSALSKTTVNYLQCAALPNTASTSRWQLVERPVTEYPGEHVFFFNLVDVDPTVIHVELPNPNNPNAKHLWNSMVPNMCKYPTPWDGIGSAPFDTLVNATMVKRRSFSLLLLVEDAPWWRRH